MYSRGAFVARLRKATLYHFLAGNFWFQGCDGTSGLRFRDFLSHATEQELTSESIDDTLAESNPTAYSRAIAHSTVTLQARTPYSFLSVTPSDILDGLTSLARLFQVQTLIPAGSRGGGVQGSITALGRAIASEKLTLGGTHSCRKAVYLIETALARAMAVLSSADHMRYSPGDRP